MLLGTLSASSLENVQTERVKEQLEQVKIFNAVTSSN